MYENIFPSLSPHILLITTLFIMTQFIWSLSLHYNKVPLYFLSKINGFITNFLQFRSLYVHCAHQCSRYPNPHTTPPMELQHPLKHYPLKQYFFHHCHTEFTMSFLQAQQFLKYYNTTGMMFPAYCLLAGRSSKIHLFFQS